MPDPAVRRVVTNVGKPAFRRGNGLIARSGQIEEPRLPAIGCRFSSGVDQRLVTRYTCHSGVESMAYERDWLEEACTAAVAHNLGSSERAGLWIQPESRGLFYGVLRWCCGAVVSSIPVKGSTARQTSSSQMGRFERSADEFRNLLERP